MQIDEKALEADYAAVCQELGCVAKSGVALRFVQDLRKQLSQAHERQDWLLRSWDDATITERQELDRMRRGWGPTTPTERMRRKDDVRAAMHCISSAMSDVTLSEEDAEAADPEVNRLLDEAHERLREHYAATIAILDDMEEPLPRPDLDYSEVVACLKHAVHWHDQLSPSDIARFEAALEAAKPPAPEPAADGDGAGSARVL